jgi:cation transport ATPase
MKFIKEYIHDSAATRKYIQKYNDRMKSKRSPAIFLILGMAFLAIGIATDQTAFSWIAIAFLLISLATGGRWLRHRK